MSNFNEQEQGRTLENLLNDVDPDAPPKAFAYLRVSSKGQESGDGLARQRREVVAYAEENGYYLGGVYEESVTGTTEDREVFSDMVAHAIRYQVPTIIIEGMDRLARELRVQETLIIYLASKGIQLISARTGEDVTEAIQGDPMKVALIQMQGVFSQLEKGMLVQKLRKARTAIKKSGQRCEGRKPYGYYEPERVILDEMVRLWLGGSSYTAIARSFNMRSIRTRSGGQWHPYTVSRIVQRERGNE